LSEDQDISKRIASELQARIQCGEFGTHGRLPSAAQIARNYKTTRPTVYRAFELLIKEGYIIKEEDGFFARRIIRVITGNDLPSFEKSLELQSRVPFVENIVTPQAIMLPAETAALFEVPQQEAVHRFRKQGADNIVYRIAEYWYLLPEAHQFIQEMTENPSANIAHQIGLLINLAEQDMRARVTARPPSTQEVALLATEDTVVETLTTNSLPGGKAILLQKIVYVASRITLEYRYQIGNR
jgi:DNA-binding GntR family transcriptional regulator